MAASLIKEVPRPDFKRKSVHLLNGQWQFAFDDERKGVSLGWHKTGVELDRVICVPFVYQSAASGINSAEIHETVWYKRRCEIPSAFRSKRVFLHFGAVDYAAVVYIDGQRVAEHSGGYTPFQVEITSFCANPRVTVAVEAFDPPDPAQPRGKQFWKETPDRCWYLPSTGIWQSVWLEAVDGTALSAVAITPDIDRSLATFSIETERFALGQEVEIELQYQQAPVVKIRASLPAQRSSICVSLLEPDYIDEIHYWSPERPQLYDAVVRLYENEEITDEVQTYFGMRKIAVEEGQILLNNQPIYLKMILDQGYWEESGMTPPTEEALMADIRMMKAMGFNGVRKHQKIEDPRFYYWADRLGLLVWGELPSAYQYGGAEIAALTRDLQEFVRRDYNHPCIMAWVPLNESWGVRKMRDSSAQQSFGRAVYHLLKALDQTRVVCTNDGWENVTTDIVGIHDYARDGGLFAEKYAEPSSSLYPMSRRLYARGEEPARRAVMITEYGGMALAALADGGNWGYNGGADSIGTLLEGYASLTLAILSVKSICGFCYTQLSDVHQEVNGLLDSRHQPKMQLSRIAEINSGLFPAGEVCP